MPDRTRRTVFGNSIVILATVGMLVVLSPFWAAIFWAIVLAILFWPLRQRLIDRMLGWTAVSSGLIIVLIVIFILFPAFLIAGLIADGAAAVVAQIQSGAFKPAEVLETLPTRFPKVADFLSQLGLDIGLIKSMVGQGFVSAGQFAVSNIAVIGQSASAFLFNVFLALYVLFALLQNGDRIYRSFYDSFPASEHSKIKFFGAFSDMAVATIKGMVSVGIVQAILGGAIFWFLDVPSPVFWGALMGLFSVVPPFGAAFIWGPAGLMMMLNGNFQGGLVLLAFGAGVISMSDNVVRPIVVGRASSVPGYMVLVTTLGGLAMFGLTGLVLGPVIASLFLSVWRLFDEAEHESSVTAEPERSDASDPATGEETS
ncbi:AI-2E family transporter [Sedimentitalea todarodis]|uniref:AI-2E family transporter n=1 Tax=Sedimentitalea todarodis TaxID=1631240 RepID=A0ABU3VGS0_9RHOB|nr:AI-2E family transporter [Sedimentitalea todarodis]MDU9005185.1 AI-2E family transporter [Sedimentitalea todarodis]